MHYKTAAIPLYTRGMVAKKGRTYMRCDEKRITLRRPCRGRRRGTAVCTAASTET
jgi:hypothetical protein